MSQLPSASYILPYRGASEDRARNLRQVLQWLVTKVPWLDIVLVELDLQPSRGLTPPGGSVQHIFRRELGIFNRSRARNLGSLFARGSVLIFGDCDVVVDPRSLVRGIEACRDEHEAVKPFDALLDVDEAGLRRWQETGEAPWARVRQLPQRGGPWEVRSDLNFAAALFAIRRESFFRIGGWPEEMMGWGAEDDVMSYKIDRFCSRKTFSGWAFHLPHARTPLDTATHEHFDDNCRKMNRVFRLADDDLVRYCLAARRRVLEAPENPLPGAQRKSLLLEVPTLRRPSPFGVEGRSRTIPPDIACYPMP